MQILDQYKKLKAQYPDVLLFRVGDFYEAFYDDATLCHRILGLTLTTRDKASTNPTPMAGFPHHQLDNYLRRLAQAGQRVSVCEMAEDTKPSKGVAKREVTRIVTPEEGEGK